MVLDRFPRLELFGTTDIELKEKSGEISVSSTLRVLVVKFVITLAPDSLVIEAVAAVAVVVSVLFLQELSSTHSPFLLGDASGRQQV